MLDIQFAISLAKFLRSYYRALVSEGFTAREALDLISSFQFSLLSLTCNYKNFKNGG